MDDNPVDDLAPEKGNRKKQAEEFQEDVKSFERLMRVPKDGIVRIVRVTKRGFKKTNADDALHLIHSSIIGGTLGDVIMQAEDLQERLLQTGCFKRVRVSIVDPQEDTTDDGAPPYEAAQEFSQDVSIILDVEEKSYTASVRTETGDTSGGVDLNLALRNVRGKMDTLTLEGIGSFGTTGQAPAIARLMVDYLCPIWRKRDHYIRTSFGILNMPMLMTSSCEQREWAFTSSYSMPHPTPGPILSHLTHKLTYQGIWRHIHNVSPSASFSIRQSAGHSLKSSLKYEACVDTRDNPFVPLRGGMVKGSLEVAGLGGDAQFAKGEVKSSYSVGLLGDLTLLAFAQGGAMMPVGGKRTHVSDRFFLGGPTELRGSSLHGVGPSARRMRPLAGGAVNSDTEVGRDAIGGELYYLGGLHLMHPLPALPAVRAQAFVNAGSLIPGVPGVGLSEHARALRSTPRATVGVGVLGSIGGMRIELNLAHVVCSLNCDTFVAGPRLGISGEW